MNTIFSLCNTCTVTLLHAISYIPTSYRLHGLCVAKSNNHHLYCIHKRSLTHFTYTKPNPNRNRLYMHCMHMPALHVSVRKVILITYRSNYTKLRCISMHTNT